MAKVTDVGTFTVSWNAVPIRDLLHYEVQWSSDATFVSADLQSDTTGNTRFTPTNLGADTTYYVRVRAVNQDFNAGPWSSRVSSLGGKVLTANINPNAASEIHSFTKTSGFTKLDTDAESETYGPVIITVADSSAVVLPRTIFEFDFGSEWQTTASAMSFTIDLLRRPSGGGDTIIDSVTSEVKSTLPGHVNPSTFVYERVGTQTVRMVAPSFTTFDQPGAGTWEYRVRVTTNIAGASNSMDFLGVSLEMEFIQSKR